MKKIILTLGLVLLSLVASAQNITFSENIPEEAAEVLSTRLQAMLKTAGLAADTPLVVDATVTDRVETSGSIAQLALSIDLVLTSGEVSGTFPLKGVGEDETDAWIRASKQFLPRSQATKEFTDKLR